MHCAACTYLFLTATAQLNQADASCLYPPALVDWTPMANSRFWASPTREPKLPVWLPWLEKSEKKSSRSRNQRNKERLEELAPRQRERIRIMSGAFDDQEVDEKIALQNSEMLDVERGDVLVGQSGRYLHPRLFKVI